MSNAPATSGADLYQCICDILFSAKTQARRAVNDAMLQAYWHVGRLIVGDEQGGEKRAEYGKRVLPELAKRLSVEFGQGFSAPSLWNYRQFYLEFPILSTAWRESSWSHFKMLMRMKNSQARAWYANETDTQSWSVRALDQQMHRSRGLMKLLAIRLGCPKTTTKSLVIRGNAFLDALRPVPQKRHTIAFPRRSVGTIATAVTHRSRAINFCAVHLNDGLRGVYPERSRSAPPILQVTWE